MIDWKLHLIFALLLALLWFAALYFAAVQLSGWELAALVALTAFASLFPDVDMKKSKIRSFVSLITAFALSLVYLLLYRATWYYAPVYFLLLYFILKYLPTKHRGITHTFKFSLIFSIATAYLCHLLFAFTFNKLLFWFVVVLISYNLHLFLDRI